VRRREVLLAVKPALEREQLGQSVAVSCEVQVHLVPLLPHSNPLCVNPLGSEFPLADGKHGFAEARCLGEVMEGKV